MSGYVCPKCHVGELELFPDEDGQGIEFIECVTCGFSGAASEFTIVTTDEMPPASDRTFTNEAFYDFPLDEGIKFWIEQCNGDAASLVYTNVPHYFDSGAEFRWGYLGAGPSLFSLNILETVLRHVRYQGFAIDAAKYPHHRGRCFQVSYDLRHKFKEMFVSRFPQDGPGIIPISIVLEFLAQHNVYVTRGG